MPEYFTVTRDYSFCAAHRVPGHPKCGRLHGHNYQVRLEIGATALDDDGFVIDFGDMDAHIKPLIDDMDHRYLVPIQDKADPHFADDDEDEYALIAAERGDACIINAETSTAESMAKMFVDYVHNSLKREAVFATTHLLERTTFIQVTVNETPRNSAVYTLTLD